MKPSWKAFWLTMKRVEYEGLAKWKREAEGVVWAEGRGDI